jgi:hypothetical protein
LVLEDSQGRLVALEIKSSATINRSDLKHIHSFAEGRGDKFHRAIILYTGTTIVPFAKNIHAVPISSLW